jgi:hypothetical protein
MAGCCALRLRWSHPSVSSVSNVSSKTGRYSAGHFLSRKWSEILGALKNPLVLLLTLLTRLFINS